MKDTHEQIVAYFIALIALAFTAISLPIEAEWKKEQASAILYSDSILILDRELNQVGMPRYYYPNPNMFFVNGLSVVEDAETRKKGYINSIGGFAMPLLFDEAYPFFSKRMVVKKKGKGYSVVTKEGRRIVGYGKYDRIFPYSNGYAQFLLGDKTGFIDTEGNEIVGADYFLCSPDMNLASSIGRYSEGFVSVKTETGKSIYLGIDGRKLVGDFTPAGCFSNGLALVQTTVGYTYISRTGDYPIIRHFKKAKGFSEGLAYVEEIDGRKGFINTTGKLTIALKPNESFVYGFTEGRAVIARNEGKDCSFHYIDNVGHILFDNMYDYVTPFRSGFAFVANDKWSGMINVRGEKKYPVEPIWSICQMHNNSGKWWEKEYFSPENCEAILTTIASPFYTLENLLARKVVTSRYRIFSPYSEGLAIFTCDAIQYGFVDMNENAIIKAAYVNAMPFSEGLAAVKSKIADETEVPFAREGWGYINKDGSKAIPFVFKWAGQFLNGMAVVEMDGREELLGLRYQNGKKFLRFSGFAVIDRKGQVVFTKRDCILPSLDSTFVLKDRNFSHAFYISKEGDRIFEKKWWYEARPFSQGLAFVLSMKDSKMDLIDNNTKIVRKEVCDDARVFSEGLCAVKIGEKWGYADVNGIVVIDAIYDKAYDFEDGLAPVLIRSPFDHWDLINKKGEPQIESKCVQRLFYGSRAYHLPGFRYPMPTPLWLDTRE